MVKEDPVQKYRDLEIKYFEILKKNQHLELENQNLRAKISTLQLEFSAYQQDYGVLNDTPELRWMKEIEQWDRVVIYDSVNNKEKHLIQNKTLLKLDLFAITGVIKKGLEPPSPSGIEKHLVYQFTKDKHEYIIQILRDNLFVYNDQYYESSGEALSLLGNAFLLGPKYLQNDSILNKIHGSSIFVGSKQFTWPNTSKFRIRLIANQIQRMEDNGQLCFRKSWQPNPDELVEEFTFFNHGAEIKLLVYSGYICIKDKESEYWYQGMKNIDVATAIITNITAN